jgi:hypothetical protein
MIAKIGVCSYTKAIVAEHLHFTIQLCRLVDVSSREADPLQCIAASMKRVRCGGRGSWRARTCAMEGGIGEAPQLW